jgi:3'(2'), 5'-bisphosphate nucleotidase
MRMHSGGRVNRAEMIECVIEIARTAGGAILEIYATEFAVRGKTDASPVTEADEKAEAIIQTGLERCAPGIPIVSEEAASAGRIPEIAPRFWLVDPMDGTKEFIGRSGEFTVNIALIEQRRPVLGVVYAPALDRLYAGVEGMGAFVERKGVRSSIHCRACSERGLTVVASRSHGDVAALDAFLANRSVASIINAGSSLKLCLVAAGEADLYPRLGRTMEWDIAAGHAVVNAAGGRVTSLGGADLEYGKPGFENPHFVVSGADRSIR